MTTSRHCLLGLFMGLLVSPSLAAQELTLLPAPVVAALAQELSGEQAKRSLEFIVRLHRTRGSRQFRAAADFIAGELRRFGLSDVRVEEIPADGRIFYGTQRSRAAWDAEFAELWELGPEGDGTPRARLASWDAEPMTLAQDSESADVTAELVDVGTGTTAREYEGRDVRGRIVLAGGMPESVAPLAVDRFGALGIVSYARNQRTAWWGDDDSLVRWGHLGSFRERPTFAFMVSPRIAHALSDRLAGGERVRLHAVVRAGQHPGTYDIVTASLPGADPKLRDEEIVFSCHLDHPRPGANDNASGCATILEAARTLSKLVAEGRLNRPARSLRFVWPQEIEGTMAFLHQRADLVPRMKAVVHMDMVGGGPDTKSVFRISRGPASLPSAVYDVAEAIGEFVNEQSDQFASTGEARLPLVAPEGGKEALLAQMTPFESGSDHQIYSEGSFRIPVIYLHDWPDRYIHTTADSSARIDPTKLKRAGFVGAASAWFLANLRAGDLPALSAVIKTRALQRAAALLARQLAEPAADRAMVASVHFWQERAIVKSIDAFVEPPPAIRQDLNGFVDALERLLAPASPPVGPGAGLDGEIYERANRPRGPVHDLFGYDYFADRYGTERAQAVRLLRFQGARGSGADYAYEVLNLVDGRRSVRGIRDFVSATYGPVPLDVVQEYLRALASIGIVSEKR